MRLFTGIAVEEVPQIWSDLRQGIALNWTPASRLHVTLKFIGEWPEARLEELQNELARIPRPGVVPITISGLGFLPNPRRPRIFFAGVRGGPGLAELAKATENALEPLGCKREERPHFPHITLARIGNENLDALRERIASMENSDFGSFEAKEFHLYLSRNSEYLKLASYSLA